MQPPSGRRHPTKLVEVSAQAAQDGGVARSAVERLAGQVEQRVGVEAGGQAPQAQRCHVPVRIASRSAEQVDEATGAVDESGAQLMVKVGIGARRLGEMGF